MERVKRIRLIFTAFLLLALSLKGNSLMAAGQDSGWFQGGCTGAEYRITKIHDLSGHQIIFMQKGPSNVWEFMAGEGWIPVQGMLCTSDTECKDASNAKLRVDEMNKKKNRMKGKYSLDIDGRHLEGNFVLNWKAHHDVEPYICE